jgi:hypothetical protein
VISEVNIRKILPDVDADAVRVREGREREGSRERVAGGAVAVAVDALAERVLGAGSTLRRYVSGAMAPGIDEVQPVCADHER